MADLPQIIPVDVTPGPPLIPPGGWTGQIKPTGKLFPASGPRFFYLYLGPGLPSPGYTHPIAADPWPPDGPWPVQEACHMIRCRLIRGGLSAVLDRPYTLGLHCDVGTFLDLIVCPAFRRYLGTAGLDAPRAASGPLVAGVDSPLFGLSAWVLTAPWPALPLPV